LLGFIDRAVFTAPRLEALATNYDLVRKFRAPNQEVAVDRMRQHIDVGIWQDYFADYRQGQDPPRTVRVTIEFSAPDPETALAVARDLGQLVAETQTQREADSAAESVKGKRILAESAAARANSLHEEFERMKVDALEQPGGNAYVGLQRMKAAVQAADAASAALAGDLVDAQLRERAIRQVGHLVQVVDPGAPLWSTLSRAERLAGQGALSLGLGIFLAVFLVGALDPTIRDEQDLRRVRIPYLGNIPASTDDIVREV
jgi:murein DD-endopeptidase MepM/ murein hydrolase activator NlpD